MGALAFTNNVCKEMSVANLNPGEMRTITFLMESCMRGMPKMCRFDGEQHAQAIIVNYDVRRLHLQFRDVTEDWIR